jgi:hypothetical protein
MSLSRGNPTYAPDTAPSNALVAAQTLTTSTTTFTNTVTQRLFTLRTQGNTNGASQLGNGFMLQNGTGMSSGDNSYGPMGIWGSYSYSESDDDNSSTSSEANRNTFMAGVDISLRDDFVLGLAVGYEDSDVDTKFNRGNVDSDGFTYVAYGAMLLDDTYSIDVMGGFSYIDIDQYRTAPGTNNRITSSTDSNRLFFAGNVNATRQYANWLLTGRVGLLWAGEGQDPFFESDGTPIVAQDFEVGQLRFGGDAAYLMGNWEPYGSLMFEYDYVRTDVTVAPGFEKAANDHTGAVMGVGLRYFGDNGIAGNIEYSSVLGREDYSEGTLNLMLRAEF